MEDAMNINEAITGRKSIRKFKSDPVPQELLAEIIKTASRAPSAENTQPWEFTVITGNILQKIKEENIRRITSGDLTAEEASFVHNRREEGSVYRKRQVEIAKRLFKLMDIGREDKDKRNQWMLRGFRYFDAPCALIISMDTSLPETWTYFDIGLVTQNFCLAALEKGVYTCIEKQGVTFKGILREFAGIPDNKQPVISIAVGYPDWDFPANNVESPREDLDNFTTWSGF
jgi:nitroreductase